jgi:hypothetical protein
VIEVKGSITQLKSRINASGDTVQTLVLEVHGDFAALHALMQSPLAITLRTDGLGE